MGSVARELYTPSPVHQAQPPASAETPTLYLVRHAQAEHNVNPAHGARRDTVLTETGRTQAAKLRATLPDSLRRNIGAVVASPLRRALLTALIGFEDLIIPDQERAVVIQSGNSSAAFDISHSQSPRLRVIALAEAQEANDFACDVGLPIADLVAELEAPASKWRGCVDLNLVSAEEWGCKTGRWSPDRETLEQRGREARRWLREKMRHLSSNPNREICADGEGLPLRRDCVLVTHGEFLHYLTEDWEGFDARAGTGWANTEMRAYHFVAGLESGTDANATIVETEDSRQPRLKDKKARAKVENDAPNTSCRGPV